MILLSFVNFLIFIRNTHVGFVGILGNAYNSVVEASAAAVASFWARYSSTYSLFWPERLPLWHHRCIASLFSTTTVLEDFQATLTYPYPTRFVCEFSHDIATYAVVSTLVACALLGSYVLYSLLWHVLGFGNPIAYYWSTLLAHPFKTAVPVSADLLRPVFNDLTLRPAVPIDNHTHPVQASLRAAVTSGVRHLAASVGLVPYFVQRSRSDNKKGLEGCETVVWCKDAHRTPIAFAPLLIHLIAFIDTSDYIDLNVVLGYGLAVVVYTVVTSAAAKVTEEYSYTYDADGYLIFNVKGGANYRQLPWNYGKDMVTAIAYSPTGLWLVKTVFNVDRKYVDADHQLILFTPLAAWRFLLFDFNKRINCPLERLEVVKGDWARVRVLGGTDQPHVVSTARVGRYLAATVSVEVDDALAETAGLSKNALQASTTQTIAKTNAVDSSVLTSYHRELAPETEATVYVVEESVVRYQHASTYEAEAPTLLEPFMPALGPDCYLPQDTVGNRRVAVGTRIQKNVSSVTQIAANLEMALSVARDHIIKTIGRHALFPISEDEVRECQPTPQQQHLLDTGALVADLLDSEQPIRAFEKAEPAQKVAAPRIISPDEPAHKLLWSRYMIPFHRAMVKYFGVDGEGWYAPGMTPASIARRVAEVCEEQHKVTMADGDKFDSSISPVARAWELSVYMGVFNPSTHDELVKGAKASHCCPVVFQSVAYEQLCGRGSGFADTTVANTLWNWAKDFVAAATERLPAGLRTKEEALRRCGIYMGDDSLCRYINKEHLIAVGAALGLVLEVEEVCDGEDGVNFISRYYSRFVFRGDPSSTCDVSRISSKLNVAPKMKHVTDMTPKQKLVQRMIGLFLSDRNTPLIGEYASAVVHAFGRPAAIVTDLAGYYAALPRASQFPNENVSGWMEDFWMKRRPDLMLDLVPEFLGLCVFDPNRLLSPPRFFRPAPVVAPPDMVTDVPSSVEGKPFPAMITVKLEPEEREVFREAIVESANAIEQQSIVNDNNATEPKKTIVRVAADLVGNCRDCAKPFLAPLLSVPQRAKLELGEPFRCRDCAAKAKVEFELSPAGIARAKLEATPEGKAAAAAKALKRRTKAV